MVIDGDFPFCIALVELYSIIQALIAEVLNLHLMFINLVIITLSKISRLLNNDSFGNF